MSHPSRVHLPALDGLRGIAILLVLLFHVPGFEAWFKFGWIGVDLFFVLSGFLITSALLDGVDRPRRARTFYVRRALRILPLGYGAIVLALVVMPYLTDPHDPGYRHLAANQVYLWTYTANWPVARGWGNNGSSLFVLDHFWSLAVEEQFYLLWPLVIWWTSRATARRVAWAVIIGGPVCRLAFVLAGAYPTMLYFFTPCRLDGLAVGSLVALSFRDPADTERVIRRAGVIAAVALVLLLVWTRGSVANMDPRIAVVGYSFLAWMFGWLVTAAALRPAALWRTPALVSLGRYSYGLYVFHPLVQAVVKADGSAWYGGLRSGLLVLVASYVVAYLSYHGYEKWFLRLKDRLAPR
ncbi:MAG TPA: acyltransferase [Gemmatimonadaceae bacterium]|nr:acyltransferase [Gemmatimonadaceae bacterium]